jgi:hypothetical protein
MLVPALVAAKTTQVAAPTDDVGWAPVTVFGRLVVGWVSMLAGLEENQAELAHLNFVAVG